MRLSDTLNQPVTPVRMALVRTPPNGSDIHFSRSWNTTTLITNTSTTGAPVPRNYGVGSIAKLPLDSRELSLRGNLFTATTTKRPAGLEVDGAGARVIIEISTPPSPNSHPGAEEALLNRSSVLFVAVSFVLLMVISLAWLVFYYVQRFRYLHSKERVSRRLAELAKKAVARIPVKTLHPGDKETLSDMDQCAICIEPYRPMDQLRILPCRHYFHKLCIDPWLLEQRSCPMCKLDILQAYGLRTDFYFNLPGAESAGGPGHVSLLGTIRSGFASASGSDDGMERIALVHSSSLTTGPAPSLAYVVLSAASTCLPPLNVPNTNESVSDVAGRYYTQSSTSDLRVQPPLIQQHFVGPITPLGNQVVVPVLPSLAAITPQVGPESTAGFFVWNRDICAAAALGVTETTAVNISGEPHTIECSIPTLFDGGLVPGQRCAGTFTLRHSTNSAQWPVGIIAASSGTKVPEVTSTTQAFTGPVCSVIMECEGDDFPAVDSSTASASFEGRVIQDKIAAPRITMEEVSPHSLDSFGSVYGVAAGVRNDGDMDHQVLTTLEGSVPGCSTNAFAQRTDNRHPRKSSSRHFNPRSRMRLPVVMSGINRLPWASWLTAPWLRFRSGRSVHRRNSSSPAPYVFRPTIQAGSPAIPSDPLLVQPEPHEFTSTLHGSVNFHSVAQNTAQSQRTSSERVVVAVVETVPDRLQTSSSNDSDSSGTDSAGDNRAASSGGSGSPLPDECCTTLS
ncbi:hypothetical protein CSKR_100922 [Clonorchis sinensis]|nr:hypothetical protein CSKR_100922 [Clonorchis sinensis]